MLSLVFSDLHLDARTCGMPRFIDLDVVLNKLVEAAHFNKVDRVVFLGDLCDPGAGAHRCVARAIEFADALPCQSVWLTGNHDVVEDGNGASVLEPMKAAGYTVIDQVIQNDMGIWLPYVPRSRNYNPGDAIERLKAAAAMGWSPCAVWGHLNLEGIAAGSETDSMPRGRDVFWPLDTLDRLLPGVPLFGGHYHQAQEFKGVRIIGAPARFTFGEEASEPRFMLVDLGGKRPRIASHKILSRRVYTIPIEHAPEVEPGDIVRFIRPDDVSYTPKQMDEVRAAALRAAASTTVSEYEPAAPPKEAELASAAAGETYEQAAVRIAAEWEIANAELSAAIAKLVVDVIEEEQ